MANDNKKEPSTAEAIAELARALKPQGPLEKAGFSAEKIDQLTGLPKPQRWRKVACKSFETDATFVAVVIESKSHPDGRIIQFESYMHPTGITTYRANGGLVPDGMQILRAGIGAPQEGAVLMKHECTPKYLQWRWEEFWQKDLRRFVGRPLTPALAVDAQAFKTPWVEGRVGAIEAA